MLILLLSSCNKLVVTKCNLISAMDTTISITFYNDDNADEHYKYIKNLYQKYSNLLDNYSGNNNLCDLNSNRTIESLELKNVIDEALKLKDDTNGYFNPLIGRLSKKWKEAISNNEVLSDEIIEEELDIMNSSSIEIEGNTISITGNADIDLGGFAKGYVTKLAIDYLKENNVDGYLIDAGESTVALGKKGSDDFKVLLEAPYQKKEIKLLSLSNNSISTSSGKYQNKIINDIRYHHLINPYTGYPANIYDNVNIIMTDPMVADAYSTAIFAMELDDAKSFINNKGIKAILYKNGEIIFDNI
jgi:thiamine biosynthesis lipoprotein